MNEFDLEREMTRTEIAAYLRKLADGMERDDKVTFVVGDESATINPPEHAHVRMETSTDSSWLGGDEGHSFYFELGWEPDETESDQELTIITQPGADRDRDDDRAAEATPRDETSREESVRDDEARDDRRDDETRDDRSSRGESVQPE